MKKFAFILVALMATATAQADVVNLDSGNNDVRMTDCGLLANDIVIGLTQNVTGNLNCDDTTTNHVAISVCHTKGLSSSRSSVVTTDASGTVTCTVTATENCVETVSGSVFPSVTTENGTVTQIFPETTCTQGNAATQAAALISAIQ